MMQKTVFYVAVTFFYLFCVSVSAKAQTSSEPEFFVPSLQLKHETRIDGLAMSGNGHMLATTTTKWEDKKAIGIVHLWNLENGQETKSWKAAPGVIHAIVFSPDGKTLAVGDQNTITLWNTQGKKLKTLTGHSRDVHSLQFSPDGKYLASGSLRVWQRSLSGELFLWDLKTSQKREVLMEEDGGAGAIAFSPDSSLIAAPQSLSQIGIWNVKTSEQKLVVGDKSRTKVFATVEFSPNGQTISAGDANHGLRLWNANTGKLEATLLTIKNNWNGSGPSGNINGISFMPDGKTMISAGTNQEGPGGEAELLMWDLSTHQILHSLQNNHAYGIRYFAASADSKIFATAETLNPTVKIYRLP